jgi:hypothetical protein
VVSVEITPHKYAQVILKNNGWVVLGDRMTSFRGIFSVDLSDYILSILLTEAIVLIRWRLEVSVCHQGNGAILKDGDYQSGVHFLHGTWISNKQCERFAFCFAALGLCASEQRQLAYCRQTTNHSSRRLMLHSQGPRNHDPVCASILLFQSQIRFGLCWSQSKGARDSSKS